MGIIERKIREKEGRKALILQKARELILEHGVDYLNMQEIADGVEFSKATLYLYFQNKEAILTAILEEASSTFVKFVRDRIASNASGLEAIHALWTSYLDFFGESEDIFILMGISRYVNPGFPLTIDFENAKGSEPMSRILKLITEILGRGLSEGTISATINPEKTARIVLMVTASIVDQIARIPRGARDNSKIRVLLHDTFEILLRGLAGSKADLASLVLP